MAQLGRVFVASFFLVDGMQWLSKHTLLIGVLEKPQLELECTINTIYIRIYTIKGSLDEKLPSYEVLKMLRE